MRALVVEDQPLIARFLCEGLEGEGFVARSVTSGSTAIEMARGGGFDVILLDWMLPDLDGPAVCSTLRNGGVTVPIVMLTARDAVRDRVHGLDCGADDYLTKPFAFEELFARIRSVMRRSGAGAAPEIRVGDLVIDPAGRTVARGGQQITLTSKEYALLEYLARHTSKACSREELRQHVWGYDYDPQTNVVDVYVGYLRRKVDRGFAPALLHTVPGFGYRLGG